MLSFLSVLLVLPSQLGHAAKKTEIIISAAASLKESMEEIKPLFEAEYPNVTITYNFGSSGTLQKQIEQGAPADVFISAGSKQMQALINKELVEKSDTANLLLNQLVMVTPVDSKQTFTTVKELTNKKIKYIAIGQPETVPAGTYTQQVLTTRKIWDTLKDKFVYAKDVRQVLELVETGNADAGFVYKTDAITSKKVKIAINILSSTHKPIVYPMGIIKDSEHKKEASLFYDYLKQTKAQQVFVKHGFKQAQK
jgi:molybdate transport system substrate-binding protein